jgi:hypothetical protein
MTTSLSNPAPSARPVDGFDESPHDEDNPCEARLRGLSRQQLADRLTWLSWYQPGIFTAVMDYMEFTDNLAADTDPTNPDSDPDDPDYGEEPAPVCGRCGADMGIFIKSGLLAPLPRTRLPGPGGDLRPRPLPRDGLAPPRPSPGPDLTRGPQAQQRPVGTPAGRSAR